MKPSKLARRTQGYSGIEKQPQDNVTIGMKSQGAISSQNLDVERDGFTKMEMKLDL